MYHHRPKKENNECQTDLQCTPFILNENETARVHSTRLCQTEIQLSPRAPDTELYKLIPYIDENDIERNAIRSIDIARKRTIKLQFFLPVTKSDTFIDNNDYKYIITDGLNEGVTYLKENEHLQRSSNQSFLETHAQKPLISVDSSSSVGTLKSAIKKILKEDDSTQTDLMIAPHILNDTEKAIITINTSCQTSVTCSPRTSLTNVVPMLKNYWEHQGAVREAFNKTENVLEILKEIIQDVINIHQHMFDQHYNLPIMNPVLIQIGQSMSSKDSSEWDTVSLSRNTKKNVVDAIGDSFENTTLSELDSIKDGKFKQSAIESISTISEVSTLRSSDFTLASTIENDDNDTDDVSNILYSFKKKYTDLNSAKSEISSKVKITQSEPTVSKGIDPVIRSKKYVQHDLNTKSLESELRSENDSKRYLRKDKSNECDMINSKCVCSGINIKLCLKDKSDDNNECLDRFIEMKVKADLESIEIKKLLNVSTEPELAGTNIPFQKIENLLVEKIDETDSTEGLARLLRIEDQPESKTANICKTDSFRITINMPKNTVLSPQTTSEQYLQSFLLSNFLLKDIENVPYPEILNKISYPSKTCHIENENKAAEKQLCSCSCTTDDEKNTKPINKKTVSETLSPFSPGFGQLYENSENLIPFDADELFCTCKNDRNEVLLYDVEYEMPPLNTNLELTGTNKVLLYDVEHEMPPSNTNLELTGISTTDELPLEKYRNVNHEIHKKEFPVSVRNYAETRHNLKSMSSYVILPTRHNESDQNKGNSLKEMYKKAVKIQDYHDVTSISYEGHVYITDSFNLNSSSDDSAESRTSSIAPEEALGKTKQYYPEISYEELMYNAQSDNVPINSDNFTTDLNCVCTQELHQIVGECPHCFRRIGPQYGRDQRLTIYDQPIDKEHPDDYCSTKQNIADGYKKGFSLPFANQFFPTKKTDSSRKENKISESKTVVELSNHFTVNNITSNNLIEKNNNLIETDLMEKNLNEIKNITSKFNFSEENVRKNIDATVDSRGNVQTDTDDPSKHVKLIEKVYSTGKIIIGKMNTDYFDATNLKNTESKSNCNYENESYPQVHCEVNLNHGSSAVEDKTLADKKEKYKTAFKTKCHSCLKAKLKQSNKNPKLARIQNTAFNKVITHKEAKNKAASKTCSKTKDNEILTIHGICSICSSNDELDEKMQCNANTYKPFISDTTCNRGTDKSEIKLEKKRSIENLQKLTQMPQLIGAQQNISNTVTKKCLSCSNLLNKNLHISSNLLQPNHPDKSCKKTFKSANTVQVIHPSKSENFHCICIKNKCRSTENIENSVCLVKKEMTQNENNYSSCTTNKQKPIQYQCSQILKQVKKKLDNLPDKQKNVKYFQCPGPPYNSLQTNCKCSKCIRSEPQIEVNKSTFHTSKCQKFSRNSVQKIFEKNLPCCCSSSSVNQNEENSNRNLENLTEESNQYFGKCNKNNDTSKNTTGITKDNIKEKHMLPEHKMFNSKYTDNTTRHMEVEKMLNDEIDDADLISTLSITTQPKVQILQIPKYIYKSYSSVSNSQFVLDTNYSICNSYNSINVGENSVKKVKDSQDEFSLANVSKSDKNVKKIMNIHKLDGKYSVFSIEENNEIGDSETTVYILPNAVFSSLISVPAPHFLRERTESEIDDIIQFSYLRNIHYERNPEFDQRTNATANSNSVKFKNIIADQNLICMNCACSCSLSVSKNQEQQTDEDIDYVKEDKTTSIANLQKNENKVHIDSSFKTNSVGIQSSNLVFHSKPHLEKISSNLEQAFKKKKYFIDDTVKLLKNNSHKIEPNLMRIMGKFITWKDLINSNLYRPIPIQNANILKPFINFANQKIETDIQTSNISSITELPEPSTAPPLTIEASTSTGNLEMETSILSSSRYYLSENLSLIDMRLQYPTTSDSSLSTANKIMRKHMFKTPSTTFFLRKKVSPTLTLEASTSTSKNQGIVQTEEASTSKLPDNPISLLNISPPDKKLIEKAFANTSALKLPTHKISSSLTKVTSLYKHTTNSSTHKLRTQSLIKIEEPSTYKVETNIGISSTSSTKIASPHINSTLGELLEPLVKSQETSTNDITSMTKITASNISKLEETSFQNLESMESYSQTPLTRDQTSCLSLPKVESQYSISESICDVTDTDTNFNKYDLNKQEWSNSQKKDSLLPSRKFIYKTSSSENVSLSVNSERENVSVQNTLLKSELVKEINVPFEENCSPSASSNSVGFNKSKDVVDTKLLPSMSMSNYINFASPEPNEEVEYNKLNTFDKSHNLELKTNTILNNPLYPSTSRGLERDENIDENLQLENLLLRAIDAYSAYLTLKKGISSNFNVSRIDSLYQQISSESKDNNSTCSKRISSLDSVEEVDSIYSYLDYIKDKDKSPLKLSNISSFSNSRDCKTDDFISKIEDIYSKLMQRKKELSSSTMSASNNYSSLKQDTSNQSNKAEEEISIFSRDLHNFPDNKIKTEKNINSVKREYSDILKREESRKFNQSLFSLKSEEDYLRRSAKEKKIPQRSTALTVSNYTDIISKNENGTSLKRPNSPYQEFNSAAQNISNLKSDKFNDYSTYLENKRITSKNTSARNLQSISKDRNSRNSLYLKKEEAISPRISTSKVAPNYSNSVVNDNTASRKNSATSRLSSFVRNGISNALLSNVGDSPQHLSEESIVLPEITLSSNRVLDVVQSCEQRLQPIKSALKDIKIKLKELNMPEVNSILQNDHPVDENKACIYLPSPPSPLVNNHCSYKTKMTFQLKKPMKPLSVTENVNPFSIKHKYILNDADNNHSTLNTNYSSLSDIPHYVQRTSMNSINHNFNQPSYSENKPLYAQNKSYLQRYYQDTYVERLHRARQPVEVIEEDLPFSPKGVERLKAWNEFQRPDSYEMQYYQPKSKSFNDYVVFPPNVKNSRVYIPVKNSLYKHEHHNYNNTQNMKMFTGDNPVWKNKHK